MVCFDHLVVDASPFINRSLVKDGAKNFYTIPEVISEIRDKAALDYFNSLPFKVVVKSPTSTSLSEIIRFAKLTGDFTSLSGTDLKLAALALDLHIEFLGDRCILHNEPASLKTLQGASKANKENESVNTQISGADCKFLECGDAEDSDDGWITPINFKKLTKQLQRAEIDDEAGEKSSKSADIFVACATNDFAAQNVLLQKGIKVVTYDGVLISSLKTFVLRCHTCSQITKDMSAKFCEGCGRPSLIKTSYALDENGNPRIFLKENFQYKLRGTKYALPAPKGGRNSNLLILAADQKEYKAALRKHKKEMIKSIIDPDFVFDSGFKGGSSAGFSHPVIGHGRKNVNDVSTHKHK